MTDFSYDDLGRPNVSRETFDKLSTLASLLEKWNPKINLVSKNSIEDLWQRHIQDSIQVFDLIPDQKGSWVDIGSGGGFPGLVVAILNSGLSYPFQVSLIESDIRKCSFLRTALRETGVKATVLTQRIEAVDPQEADVLSARALADLSLLCEFSERHLSETGTALFPKGVNWKKEVEEASKSWSFTHEISKSSTQEGAVILKLRDIKRV